MCIRMYFVMLQRLLLCIPSTSTKEKPRSVVGGHLQKFWKVWQELGANPLVVSILKEGYILPFKMKPLARSPMIQSGYANPTKKHFLKEVLNSLKEKLVVETVVIRSSLAFYNHLFLVPKPNNKWRPILDQSQLNRYLHTSTFKMETQETIHISLHKWSGSHRWTSPTYTSTFPSITGPPSTWGSFWKSKHTSSLPFLLVWPQLHLSSHRWSRKWNLWHRSGV